MADYYADQSQRLAHIMMFCLFVVIQLEVFVLKNQPGLTEILYLLKLLHVLEKRNIPL